MYKLNNIIYIFAITIVTPQCAIHPLQAIQLYMKTGYDQCRKILCSTHTTVPMLSSACTLNPRYPVGVARVPPSPPTAAP